MIPWQIVDLPSLTALPRPCGQTRRALGDFASFPGTVHLTDICESAIAHHHKEHTDELLRDEADVETTPQSLSDRVETPNPS